MKTLEKEILSTLHSVGIRFDGRGYRYVMDYIVMQLSAEPSDNAQDCFKRIAVRRRTTAYSVQSAIRFCLENANEHGLDKKLNGLFGYDVLEPKPAVKLTLNLILEYIHIYRGFSMGNYMLVPAVIKMKP